MEFLNFWSKQVTVKEDKFYNSNEAHARYQTIKLNIISANQILLWLISVSFYKAAELMSEIFRDMRYGSTIEFIQLRKKFKDNTNKLGGVIDYRQIFPTLKRKMGY